MRGGRRRAAVCRRVKMRNFYVAPRAGGGTQMCVGRHRGAEGGAAATQGVLATTGLAPDTRSAAAQPGQPRPSFLLVGLARRAMPPEFFILAEKCSTGASRYSPF